MLLPCENQDVTLLKIGESGIINKEEIQAYQSLTAEDIAARYKRADGGNLLDENFRAMPVEIQREAVRGYDRASKLYGCIAPNRLKAAKLGHGVYGKYSLTYGTITFDPSQKNAALIAFRTAIHEMTHFAEDKGLFNSQKIYKAALKRLGLRTNSRKARNLVQSVIGINNSRDVDDTHEIIAYGVEKCCAGSKNELAIAIYEMLCEEGVIQQ